MRQGLRSTAVAAVMTAAGLAAAPARGDLRTPGEPLGLSLAGDGVVWADWAHPGFTLKSAGFRGERRRAIRTFRVDPPGGPVRYVRPALSASAALVLVTSYATDAFTAPTGPERLYFEHHVGRLAAPLERIVRCPGTAVELRSVDVSGEAYAYRQCDEGLGHVEVRDVGATAQSPPRSVGSGGFGARIAGRYVAWLDGPYAGQPGQGQADIAVYDRVAGAEAYRVPAAQLPDLVAALDVQDDGKVVFAFDPVRDDADQRLRIAWAAPEEPRPHVLPLKPMDGYDVRMAGNLIGFERGNGGSVFQRAEVGVSDLAGNARVVGRGADDVRAGETFDFDGERLAWRVLGCERWVVVVRDARARPASARRTCGLRFRAKPQLRGSSLELDPSCGAMRPRCRFDIEVRTAERGPDVHAASGRGRTTPFRLPVTRAARRMLAARGSLRLTATASIVDGFGRTDTRRATFRVRR